jgi:hypothetical protein
VKKVISPEFSYLNFVLFMKIRDQVLTGCAEINKALADTSTKAGNKDMRRLVETVQSLMEGPPRTASEDN